MRTDHRGPFQFEWDEDKNCENIRKHGIDFADVPEVFDFYRATRRDDRRDYGETRWLTVGMLRDVPVL
ncbi:hypothetical protein LCGC14_2391680, partial [marine sediment metagenome]